MPEKRDLLVAALALLRHEVAILIVDHHLDLALALSECCGCIAGN